MPTILSCHIVSVVFVVSHNLSAWVFTVQQSQYTRNESYLNVVCSCCVEHADTLSPSELQLNDKQLLLPHFN